MRASSLTAHRQLIAGTVLVGVTVLVIGAALGIIDLREARRGAERDVAFQARVAADAIDHALAEAKEAVGAIASDPAVTQTIVLLAEAPQDCALTAGGGGVFSAGAVHLFSPDGAILCSSADHSVAALGLSIAERSWFEQLGAIEGPHTLGVEPDPVTGVNSVGHATVVRTSGGDIAGGILSTLTVDDVAMKLAEIYAGPQGFDFVITEADGITVVSSSQAGRRATAPLDPTGADNISRSAVAGDTGWRVFTGIEEKVALADARSDLKGHALMMVIALLGTLQLSLYLHRRITRPIRRLSDAVEQATRDVIPEPLEIEGPAEIGRLLNDFNALIRGRADSEDRFTHYTLHDPLTELPNKMLFLDRLRTALGRAHRDARTLAVFFVDLDRFGRVNDGVGHENGDRVLTMIAERLSVTVRPGDTVARFGGDQFVVLCEGLASPEDVSLVAERIQEAVALPIVFEAASLFLSASVGIAVPRREAASADQLLREADTAMAKAKSRGRGRFERYVVALDGEARDRLGIETELRDALERGELIVHYQPIVDLTSGRVGCVEALVRWQHPERGVLSPDAFIPVAEETGLIVGLGEFVLRQACAQTARWAAKGMVIDVAVNCSAQQLSAPSFVEMVAGVLESTGVDPASLCLEVTESTLLEQSTVGATLDRLKALGVKISVDDFGIGYSSLSYLQRFPIDKLKVDREFLSQLRDGNGTLVTAIVSLGRALKLEMVAEGIEESGQLLVSEMGCQSGQGFYFARPQPARNVERLIKTGFERKLAMAGPAHRRHRRAG